jgi:hypothetical protein
MNGAQDLIKRIHLINEQYRSSALKTELNEWKVYTKLGLAALAILLLARCQGEEIQVSYDKSDVVLHSWSWWGFGQRETPIVWREGKWMAQNEKGEWYVAVEEPEYDPPE